MFQAYTRLCLQTGIFFEISVSKFFTLSFHHEYYVSRPYNLCIESKVISPVSKHNEACKKLLHILNIGSGKRLVASLALRPNFSRGKSQAPEQYGRENTDPALNNIIISSHFIDWDREGLATKMELDREIECEAELYLTI